MKHDIVPSEFKTEDVPKSIEDGHTYGDPRWMLPFALPVLQDAAVPDQNTLNYSLYDLGKTGIFNINNYYQVLTLAEPSELLCKEMLSRQATIRITNLGFTTDGKPAGMTSLFVRSKNLIWYVNIGGEEGKTATWASVDFDKAGDILNELFTPVGAPAAVSPAVALKNQKTGNAKFCPTCGKEATWIDQYQRWYCYSCQKYLDN